MRSFANAAACWEDPPPESSEPPQPPEPQPPTLPGIPVRDTVLPSARLTLPALAKRPTAAYKALLGGRFTDTLRVSEAGTVTQTLYLNNGATLPKATAAKKPKRTAVGQGRATVKQPGVVKVTVKLSKKGRSRLRSARTSRLALITVLRDKAGNVRVLAPTRFTVKRVKGVK